MITKEDVVVLITKDGYVKRTSKEVIIQVMMNLY